jgi:hypothetical protein
MTEMGAWRIVVGFAGTLGVIVLTVAVYYVLSYLVLTITGRLLPLAGRRRRD